MQNGYYRLAQSSLIVSLIPPTLRPSKSPAEAGKRPEKHCICPSSTSNPLRRNSPHSFVFANNFCLASSFRDMSKRLNAIATVFPSVLNPRDERGWETRKRFDFDLSEKPIGKRK